MKNRLLPVILLAIAFLPASLLSQSFTLQQVMSAPFQSKLSASPAGNRFAWIANQQGRRNLWLADAAAGGGVRELTHYDSDDGIEIGDISWTPDGESILYVRGGD